MKNKPLKPKHTTVLTIAILLTVFSIIGSVAAASLIPLTDDAKPMGKDAQMPASQHRDNQVTNKQRDTFMHQSNIKQVAHPREEFKSAIKPKLWDCYNCGVVVAIESVPSDAVEVESELLSYLEAHRENARILPLADEQAIESAPNSEVGPDSAMYSRDIYGEEIYTSDNDAVTYLIKVRMQDGTQHVITQNSLPEHEVGDHVRLTVGKMITA